MKNQLNNCQVICIGEMIADCFLQEDNSYVILPGGAPANVACHLAQLGTLSAFIGSVGKDNLGDFLVKQLQRFEVDTTGVQYNSQLLTRKVYIHRLDYGERRFAGFGGKATTDFADTCLDVDLLPLQLFENADFIVLGSLQLAFAESRSGIIKALEIAVKSNVKVFFDVNIRRNFWPDISAAPDLIKTLIMPKVNFVKASEDEANYLWQTVNPKEIIDNLDEVEGAIVTLGSQGCVYYIKGHEGYVPGCNVPVVDTTGAGDSFNAGLIHQLCQAENQDLENPEKIEKIMTYANVVAALTVSKLGGAIAGNKFYNSRSEIY